MNTFNQGQDGRYNNNGRPMNNTNGQRPMNNTQYQQNGYMNNNSMNQYGNRPIQNNQGNRGQAPMYNGSVQNNQGYNNNQGYTQNSNQQRPTYNDNGYGNGQMQYNSNFNDYTEHPYRNGNMNNQNINNGFNGVTTKKKGILLPILIAVTVLSILVLCVAVLIKGISKKVDKNTPNKPDTTVVSPDINDDESEVNNKIEHIPVKDAIKNSTSLFDGCKELYRIPLFETTSLVNGYDISVLVPTDYLFDIEYCVDNKGMFDSVIDSIDGEKTLATIINSKELEYGLGAEALESISFDGSSYMFVSVSTIDLDNKPVDAEIWVNERVESIDNENCILDKIIDTEYGKAYYSLDKDAYNDYNEISLYMNIGNTELHIDYSGHTLDNSNVEDMVTELIGLITVEDISNPTFKDEKLTSLNGYELTNQLFANVTEPMDNYVAYMRSSFEGISLSPSKMMVNLPGNYLVDIETDAGDIEYYTVKDAFSQNKLDFEYGLEDITIYSDIYKEDQIFEIESELSEDVEYIQKYYIEDEDKEWVMVDTDKNLVFYKTYLDNEGNIDDLIVQVFTDADGVIDLGTGDNKDSVTIWCSGAMNSKLIELLGPENFAKALSEIVVAEDRF